MSILQLPAPKSNADVFPVELVDPNDLESPPELWPDWCDADTWCVTGDPLPDDDDTATWVDAPDQDPDKTPDPDKTSDPDFEPSEEDWASIREMKGDLEAREHLDRSASLSLDALADHVAEHFRSWGTEAGDLFGQVLADLARSVRQVSARSPAEFLARRDQADAVARETLEACAFDEGLRSCPCHSVDSFPSAFGHLS